MTKKSQPSITGLYPNNPNLRWHELLSRAEIQQWLSTGIATPRLLVDFDRAGIYRFVFEECRDDTTAHTACYVGETVNLYHRMKDYFPTTPRLRAAPASQKRLLAGWEVRGKILLSSGNFELQTLKLEGPVTFGGFTFGPESLGFSGTSLGFSGTDGNYPNGSEYPKGE